MEDVNGVMVVSPARFADAEAVAQALRSVKPTAVDMRGLDDTLTRRFVDFLAGAMAVAGGALERFADHVYLATPQGVDVTSQQRAALGNFLD